MIAREAQLSFPHKMSIPTARQDPANTPASTLQALRRPVPVWNGLHTIPALEYSQQLKRRKSET